ncbi:riboflavin synthase [Myxosarcina sp. GI1]|uniref:riboflavin synthase n=1 Tax=Myxosarcina sp. GI1 TaxID=1541065 RepID=UPI000565DBDD|nr:riboflavin synthase [Myxosarcina sp. GI1]
MFTGLIQSLGSVDTVGRDRLQILLDGRQAASVLEDLAVGDSVAVDGVCLTVETISDRSFIASVSPETLNRTILGDRRRAAKYANLETSLRAGSKIGGHFVTGHIDGIGCLLESSSSNNSWLMRFGSPPEANKWQERIGQYLVAKGSIAVNGISLTIAEIAGDRSWFSCAVIPHTYAETNLCYLQSGDLVNLESDILGKYVERAVRQNLQGLLPETAINGNAIAQQEDIGLNFLTEHGYL